MTQYMNNNINVNKVYMSLYDVINDIKDNKLREELMYHYEKERRKQKEEIDELENRIYDLEEEKDDLYHRLNYEENY